MPAPGMTPISGQRAAPTRTSSLPGHLSGDSDAEWLCRNRQIFVAVAPRPPGYSCGDNAICQGQSANINAGGGFASYQWEQWFSGTDQYRYRSGNIWCDGIQHRRMYRHCILYRESGTPPEPAITGNLAICPGNSVIGCRDVF